MWPRHLELLIGLWVAASPWLLDASWYELAVGLAVALLSLGSFYRATANAHYLTGLAAAALVAYGYFGAVRPGPASAQNDIVCGLLLLMLFFLPNHVSDPPYREVR